MANAWFRMYSEFAHDPKVQMLSETDQRRYIMLLCMKCSGQVPSMRDEEVAFVLRVSTEEAKATKANLVCKNLIDESWDLPGWDNRQFLSDSSADRVRRYREKRKDQGLTSDGYRKHSVTVTNRDGNKCVYCGSAEKLCIDHVLPVNLGGDDSIENLVCACKLCNSGKSGRTPDQAKMTFLNKEAELRWREWMKSNPVTVTVTPQNRTDTEQNRTDTEETTSPEKQARFDFKAALVLAGVDPNVAADYITTRKAKKCVQTETAFNLFSAESSKAGLSVADAVAICCKRGWGGFDASWIKPEDKSSVVGDGRTEHQRMSDAMLAVTGTRNFL